jgi:hypothetical protein
MKATSMKSALETVEKLRVKLSDFAKEHQSEIQEDPAFRQQVRTVYCLHNIVDACASSYECERHDIHSSYKCVAHLEWILWSVQKVSGQRHWALG